LHAPQSSHLLRDPPSSHHRLHWPSVPCACTALSLPVTHIHAAWDGDKHHVTHAHIHTQRESLARPTVFTQSTPLAVGVLRVRGACSRMQVSWPRPVCTRTKAPQSQPCPVASLTHGIVVRVPSKSFSAARKNRLLQNLSHCSCSFSGCCPPTPLRSSVCPAGRVHRPARPLTLHRPHTVDSNGRRRPARAPA
jgi:hypothetical protein